MYSHKNPKAVWNPFPTPKFLSQVFEVVHPCNPTTPLQSPAYLRGRDPTMFENADLLILGIQKKLSADISDMFDTP